MDRPAVSVCVVTYNHERFLAQALDSVLMQKTKFPFEIVIGEDHSTDRTVEIARRYAQTHPQLIALYERERNVGGNRNFILALERCRGRYVALLDGDDFWCSADKLQRQFDFLEAHPQCAACFHAATVMHEDTPERDWICRPSVIKEQYTLRDLLRQYQFQTAAAMLRASAIPVIPSWYYSIKIGDRTLFALLAQCGTLKYFDEVMSVYRVHAAGVWSGQDRIGQLRDRLAAFEALQRHFRGQQDCIIRPTVAEICGDLAARYETKGNLELAGEHARRALSAGAWRSRGQLQRALRVLLKVYCPSLYNGARAAYRQVRGNHFKRA
jgi:glycosyltransferase involved in cell wall biosynthesis